MAREQLCNKGNKKEVPLICQGYNKLGCGPLPQANEVRAASVPSACSGLGTVWPYLATEGDPFTICSFPPAA